MRSASRDEEFASRLEPHRRAITLHCYRMLGSFQDAEELAQESLVRAWQRLDELRAGDAARAWLYQIATNACLDVLKTRRRRRALPFLVAPPASPALPFGPPAPEGSWIEPAPDTLLDLAGDAAELRPDARVSMRESVGLAFIAALQLLPPKQRAVLLLIDVLGWRPRETAELIKTTVAAVNSLLQRARRALEEHGADETAALAVEDESLLGRYIATWQSGDLDAFAALLAEDAILSMPPQPEWYAGRAAIRAFLAGVMAQDPRRYHMLPLRANGAPAVASYSASDDGDLIMRSIAVLTTRAGHITRITRFSAPWLFRAFGLPERLPRTS